MGNKISALVPTRDVPLALICATAWIFVLWLAEYPADESVGVAIIGYVALWTSRLIVNALALFTLGRLRSIALRKADELGMEIPEEPSPSIAAIARLAVTAFLIAMLLAIVGLSVVATVPIAAAVDLPPLAAGFGVFGWIALGVGSFVLAMILGVPFILFRWLEAVAVNMRRLTTGISAISDALSSRPLKGLAWA